MANKLRYSFTNPLQFFNPDLVREERFNSKDFEDFEFPDTILSFEQIDNFCQPWQLNDTIKLQLETNVGPVNFVLRELKRGKVVDTIPLTQVMLSETEVGMALYELIAPLAGYEENHYYGELQFGISPVVFTLRTGRLEFAIRHEGSLVWDYKHFEHQDGLIYETGFYPSVRFFGIKKLLGSKRKATTYEDQILNMTALRSQKYREWLVKMYGCPDYFHDIMSGVIGCSDLKLDGKALTIPQENDWEPVEHDRVARRGWSIKARERYTRNSREYENDIPIDAVIIAIVESDAKGFGGDGSFNNIVRIVT